MKMRNKLLAATAMLIVSAIMMTTASFAWFSISTAPEAKISTQVVANGNLEIALNAGAEATDTSPTAGSENTVWGNIVDMGEDDIGQLKPIAITNGVPQYPVYGTDGRITGLEDLIAEASDIAGVTNYVATDGGDVWAIQIDLWLRTNIAGNISLLATAENRIEGDNTTAGGGTYIEGHNAVGMAYKVGEGTFTALTFGEDDATVEGIKRALASDTTIITNATANQAYAVSILIYLDGATVTNADVAELIEGVIANLQFGHSVELDPMDRT